MNPLPALRPVDAFPVEHDGDQYFCLYDPSSMVEERLFLTPPGIFVASQLDGLATVVQVREAFRRQFGGQSIQAEQILEIVEYLDTRGFLETQTFESLRESIVCGFRDSPVRPAYHAGRSYTDDPRELRRFLDEQFLRPGGPGALPDTVGAGDPLPGAVIPHIDYHRGGHVYAHAYAEMARRGRPDTVFLFGVAHAVEPVPFILTRKDFGTPFGTVETDQKITERLAEACTWDPFEFELTHRTEHSIEFHATMLAYLYGPEVKIVPVLCSMFGEDFHTEGLASDNPIQHFLAVCRDVVADSGVSVIASADLAHVGRCFGDDFDIDDDLRASIRKRDDEDLAQIGGNAPDEWYRSVMKDENARRVCGLNCVYSTMKTLEGRISGGSILAYDAAPDPNDGMVSFASLALE